MTLSDALQLRLSVRLVCGKCGAHQPAYVNEMIEKHSPGTELLVALKRAPCIFCSSRGDFTVLVPQHGSGVRRL